MIVYFNIGQYHPVLCVVGFYLVGKEAVISVVATEYHSIFFRIGRYSSQEGIVLQAVAHGVYLESALFRLLWNGQSDQPRIGTQPKVVPAIFFYTEHAVPGQV